MRNISIVVMLIALLAASTQAKAVAKSETVKSKSDSIWLPSGNRVHNWRAVGRDALILWSSPSKAYLVKIWRPYTSLRFAHVIGVTSFAGRVTKFDNVIVNGQRLPIRSIVALDKEVARNLSYGSHKLD